MPLDCSAKGSFTPRNACGNVKPNPFRVPCIFETPPATLPIAQVSGHVVSPAAMSAEYEGLPHPSTRSE